MASISLNLGLLNLLPIPVLDGGHILILLLEGLTRRDFSVRVKERMLLAGFVAADAADGDGHLQRSHPHPLGRKPDVLALILRALTTVRALGTAIRSRRPANAGCQFAAAELVATLRPIRSISRQIPETLTFGRARSERRLDRRVGSSFALRVVRTGPPITTMAAGRALMHRFLSSLDWPWPSFSVRRRRSPPRRPLTENDIQRLRLAISDARADVDRLGSSNSQLPSDFKRSWTISATRRPTSR